MSILRASAPARNPASASVPYKPRYAGKVYPPAAADVELLRPVCYPCTLLPDGQPGIVRINDQAYLLYPLVSFEGDRLTVEGYRFVKGDTEARDVRQERWGFECDCPDFTFRRRSDRCCKHIRCVLQLREQGNLI